MVERDPNIMPRLPKREKTVLRQSLVDHTPSQPGFNGQGGILHLGPPVAVATGLDTVNKFLNVMEWQTNADRTNAVAAFLTVPFCHHFLGGKPLVLITSTKSHGGKGTVCDFIRGDTPKAEILYESIDWPMEKSLQGQLLQRPETVIVNLDNVRLDSAGGRAKIVRSGFLESFVTSQEILLNSTGMKPFRGPNKYVVTINTNEGGISSDIANRCLPIRLAPTGNVTERRLSIGNPKLEFLPAHRQEIEAERWGMIDRWIKAGKPLDLSVANYPMSVWAQTIGGILIVNDLQDFLGNYSATRSGLDPLRQAIAILAFHAGEEPKRAKELARLAIHHGLAKDLLPGVERGNEAAAERQIGVTLRPFVGETFTSPTVSEKITQQLTKEKHRWPDGSTCFKYSVPVIHRQAVTEDATCGPILEDHANNCSYLLQPDDDDLTGTD